MRKKEQSAGKRRKKKHKPGGWQGRLVCRFETEGDPLMFASERGPLCACEKRRTVRGKEKKRKPHHSMCIALE
jgi:hypothetical protein